LFHAPGIVDHSIREDDIADEVMRHCPQVDYLHCGDAEITFPRMVRRLYHGETLDEQRGIMWRRNGDVAYAGRAPNFSEMIRTPVPDFDEYFYARKEGGYDGYPDARQVLLPLETARGGWRGMRSLGVISGSQVWSTNAGNGIEPAYYIGS